jgi:hypothetical protein
MKDQHPTITPAMLANNEQLFKNIAYKKTATFSSLGPDMIKCVIDFGFVITHGTFPSIAHGLDLRRNLGDKLNDEVVVHIKQAMQQDLIKILHPVAILNVMACIRHEIPDLLNSLNVYFTTENKHDKHTYTAAHYFVKIEDYHRFVFGSYDFDQELPTTDQFKKVHAFLSSLLQFLTFSLFRYSSPSTKPLSPLSHGAEVSRCPPHLLLKLVHEPSFSNHPLQPLWLNPRGSALTNRLPLPRSQNPILNHPIHATSALHNHFSFIFTSPAHPLILFCS